MKVKRRRSGRRGRWRVLVMGMMTTTDVRIGDQV
jgi:hypothetical protein